jgi:hypothetical protein
MILSQNDVGIIFLLGFVKAMQYPSKFQMICYGANGFMGYLKRCSACELSISGHEQYPSNNPNQNNYAHGICILPLIRYCFPCRFRQYLSRFQ